MLGPPAGHPDVLVGLGEADDAAVVALEGTDALVCTLDFFTPLVDDAFQWGQIAAANAASDVYAMGGRPFAALNVVGWPRDELGLDLLAEVLRGGGDVAERAGFVVVGGHTVDDPEPKYGMVVLGRVDPERMLTLEGARAGDVLVVTKPVGTGIVTTAIKAGAAPPEVVEAAVSSMTLLNDRASRVLCERGVRTCTDVTGFGLLGHLRRMLDTSGVGAEVEADAVPVLPGALALASDRHVPGGTRRNIGDVDGVVEWEEDDDLTRILLCDAQTSGGLLAACSPEVAHEVIGDLAPEGGDAVAIGHVVSGAGIVVRGKVG